MSPIMPAILGLDMDTVAGQAGLRSGADQAPYYFALGLDGRWERENTWPRGRRGEIGTGPGTAGLRKEIGPGHTDFGKHGRLDPVWTQYYFRYSHF